MSKKITKTIRSFQEKGFYDADTNVITGTKEGDETNVLDVLKALSKDGQEIKISITQEDSDEYIEGLEE